jgi:hypothetical protein
VQVIVGVVVLRTAADADALFTTFSRQWERCNGTKITLFMPNEDVVAETLLTTDIRVADPVLTASFQSKHQWFAPDYGDVLGVRVNCIVESSVRYGREPDSSADTIARAMMDKVSDLS